MMKAMKPCETKLDEYRNDELHSRETVISASSSSCHVVIAGIVSESA
jgi:hypothetical protein